MRKASHFGTFELAPHDQLWVEPTSIYGLLNLFYDPVAWVARRTVESRHAVLESPYVIVLEPHAGGGTIRDDQILVQGIDRTSLLTVRLGARAGERLFEHLYRARDFQQFERAALAAAAAEPAGSGEAERDEFRTHILPALYGAIHSRSVDEQPVPASRPQELYDRYRAAQTGKELDITEVLSPSGGRSLIYVHFCIWPSPNSNTAGLSRERLLAQKQVAVALFQYCAATDPTFLRSVLNSGTVRSANPVFGWTEPGEFVEAQARSTSSAMRFEPVSGGVRLIHMGASAETSDPAKPLDSACEVLVAEPQPDGTVLYVEVMGKPYE